MEMSTNWVQAHWLARTSLRTTQQVSFHVEEIPTSCAVDLSKPAQLQPVRISAKSFAGKKRVEKDFHLIWQTSISRGGMLIETDVKCEWGQNESASNQQFTSRAPP